MPETPVIYLKVLSEGNTPKAALVTLHWPLCLGIMLESSSSEEGLPASIQNKPTLKKQVSFLRGNLVYPSAMSLKFVKTQRMEQSLNTPLVFELKRCIFHLIANKKGEFF
jgi:hypothetical protein